MQKDAIEFILDEHVKIRKMIMQLKEIFNKDMSQTKSLFDSLKDFLIIHETMEQELWYPEIQGKKDFKEIVDHLKQEEIKADNAIHAIDKEMDLDKWKDKVKNLLKDVEHHAAEEENKLLPKAKLMIPKTLLVEIGSRFQEFKRKSGIKP